MKILLTTSYSPFHEVTGPIAAGAEIAMRRISELLADRGHEVHYVTFSNHARSRTVDINGVQVHFFNKGKRDSKGGPVWKRALSGIGWKVYLWAPSKIPLFDSVYQEFRTRLFSSLQELNKRLWSYRGVLLDVVRRHKIELIHCFSSLPDSYAASMVTSECRIPLVLRMGGRYWYLKYKSLKDREQREEYTEELRYVFENTDCLAFNAEVLKRDSLKLLCELNLPIANRRPVIDIGISVPKLISSEAKELDGLLDDLIDKGDIIVSCVGKFKAHSKRQDLLIQALKELPKEVRVVFAGDGPRLQKMRNLAESEGVYDRTIFLGSIPHAKVFRLLQRTHIFAHPTEFEGSSKAVAEGMLLGKAIIASDIPAFSEVLKDGINCLLAENSTEGFRDTILQLMRDSELRKKIGAAAQQFADKEYNPQYWVGEYEKLFHSLIESPQDGSDEGEEVAEFPRVVHE